MTSSLVRGLFEGPIDIVGDIHGEADALRRLLHTLGYNAHGEHPRGRRLVFLGDLCDRGPDSPAVIELVRGLVERDLAQCILGNHELNLLRRDAKHGNRWYLDTAHPEQRGEFQHSRPAAAERVSGWHDFFRSLPLALERDDLRVAHAAWHGPSIDAARASTHESALEMFEHCERALLDELHRSGLSDAAATEERAYAEALVTEAADVPVLESLARKDEWSQMNNPVRVITSGAERATRFPFWANGKWRMCDRVRWWDEYPDATPVIVGHYWRIAADLPGSDVSGGKPDLFEGTRHNEWLGPAHNVFCVDFSVGGRYRERARGAGVFKTRLAAVRWPEQELVFDDAPTVSMIR